jgi:N-acetyl-alpha-D-muramate 1-phosphate uridylyltransferase
MPELAAVVLAAGAGTRMRPLTDLVPKALCPVNNVPLIEIALERARSVSQDVAVNVHHRRKQLERHLAGRGVHLSVEEPEALGTAGAIGNLRDWIDGRPLVVTNVDAWMTADVVAWAEGWDGDRIRLMVVEDRERPDFEGRWRYAGTALMPWVDVEALTPVPSGLYEVSWGAAADEGRLELAPAEAQFVDCGTIADYLTANLASNGGESVIGPNAVVEGEVVRSLVWPGGRVRRGERLVDAIRVGETLTIDATER